jgi:hypothetical protein
MAEDMWSKYIQERLKDKGGAERMLNFAQNLVEIDDALEDAFEETDDKIIDWETGKVYPKDED